MLPADVENYVKELGRVLRPGGRALNTFFLLNSSNGRGPGSDRATIPFSVKEDGYWAVSSRTPEVAVAYEEDDVRKLYERHGFSVEGQIHPGTWVGADGPSFQDIVVATRGDAPGRRRRRHLSTPRATRGEATTSRPPCASGAGPRSRGSPGSPAAR